MTFLQAKTANEVPKAQERKLRLTRLRGELVERDRVVALVFRLARQERDAWVAWPARLGARGGRLANRDAPLRRWRHTGAGRGGHQTLSISLLSQCPQTRNGSR